MAWERMLVGKISEANTNLIGPKEKAKKVLPQRTVNPISVTHSKRGG